MKPLFLFAPGAGASSAHPWMQRWRALLEQVGEVVTFDYDYMRAGRRRPDPLARLINAHQRAVQEARTRHAGPVVLIGKSMGGRIGCHVSLVESVAGLICLGYPLCGGGDPSRRRDAVLKELKTSIFFVQGTRDSLCPLDLLEEVRPAIPSPNHLLVVEGGDHSLELTKTNLRAQSTTQAAVDERILLGIAKFVGSLRSESLE